MIKKSLKTKFIIAMLALVTCCFLFGTIAIRPMGAVADNSSPVSSFQMIPGAQVRTAEPSGMRFTAQISATEYDELQKGIENGTYLSVEFGSIICPSVYVNGELTLETEQAKSVKRTTWDKEYNPSKGTDVYQYNCDLIGILEQNYVAEFQAIGYCTITPAEGEAVTYYAKVLNEGDNARTPIYVATYNIVNNNDTSDFLLDMVDVAMEGRELKVDVEEELTLNTGDEIDLPLVTVAGQKIVTNFTSNESGIAKIENGKIVGVAYGKTKITASIQGKNGTYEKSFNVMVNDSRFINQPVRTSNEINGDRSLSTSIYYVKNDGVYMQATVNHDTLNLSTQWATLMLTAHFQDSGSISVISLTEQDVVRHQMTNGTFFAVKNDEGAKTNYTSYVTGYVSQAQLTAINVDMSKGYTGVWFEVNVPGETIRLDGRQHNVTQVWHSGVSLFGEEGWFVTEGKTQAVEFDTTTNVANNPDKKAFTYGATLNKYGLWIDIVVKADSSFDNSATGAFFSIYFRPNTNNGAFELFSYNNTAFTWKLAYLIDSTALNAGYTNTIYAKFFIDYAKLSSESYQSSADANVKYLWGANANTPITIDSSVYLNISFTSNAASDTLDYYFRSNKNLADMNNYVLQYFHTTNDNHYGATDSRNGPKNMWCTSRKFIGAPIGLTGADSTYDKVTKDGLDFVSRV